MVLLHFNYHDTGMDRADYKPKLDRCLGQPYQKADPNLFYTVLPKINRPLFVTRAVSKGIGATGLQVPRKVQSIHRRA